MTKSKSAPNPFYVALVVVGIAFFITAFAYGVMSVRAIRVGPASRDQQPQPLLTFLEEHGDVLMGGELGLLMLFTIAALATDSFWSRTLKQHEPGGEPFDRDLAAPNPDPRPTSIEVGESP